MTSKRAAGAFAKTRRFAETLAREMTLVARLAGRRATAFVTDMDEPLGYCVGNALEVAEAAEVLRGRGEPASDRAVPCACFRDDAACAQNFRKKKLRKESARRSKRAAR